MKQAQWIDPFKFQRLIQILKGSTGYSNMAYWLLLENVKSCLVVKTREKANSLDRDFIHDDGLANAIQLIRDEITESLTKDEIDQADLEDYFERIEKDLSEPARNIARSALDLNMQKRSMEVDTDQELLLDNGISMLLTRDQVLGKTEGYALEPRDQCKLIEDINTLIDFSVEQSDWYPFMVHPELAHTDIDIVVDEDKSIYVYARDDDQTRDSDYLQIIQNLANQLYVPLNL